MRRTFWTSCALLLLLAGCAPTFTGEWLEDASAANAGKRRAAITFDGVSTVRTGAFDNDAKVVDAESVQSSDYFVFDGGKTAQFGAVIASLRGNTMIAATPGAALRTFTRQHGHSIFPPLVRLPQLSSADKFWQREYAVAIAR